MDKDMNSIYNALKLIVCALTYFACMFGVPRAFAQSNSVSAPQTDAGAAQQDSPAAIPVQDTQAPEQAAAQSQDIDAATQSSAEGVVAQSPAAQTAVTPASTPAPAVVENIRNISLDIKGMDIVDVLKMLATRAQINVVIGKNVTGRVTLFLKDVDVWDAFELILLSNELAYDKKGNIVNVMTQRDYELQYGDRFQDNKQAKIMELKYAKAADLARALGQIKSNVGKIVVDEASNTIALIDTPEKVREMESFIQKTDMPLQTRVFSLNYALVEKLTPKLQEILTKGVGTIRMDERTNKLVVTDYPNKLMEIADVISAFDEQTMQVLIDAQIIEIKPSDKFEMGVDWDYWLKSHFRLTSAMPVGTTGRLLLGTTTETPSEKGDYKAILDILRTIGDTKILSSPRIMALNNQEAKILVGTKDAYITSTTTTTASGPVVSTQTVNFVDVGIKLYVTPTINREGFVTMKIRPEISSSERTDITSEGKITQIPIVTTSEAETAVMIKDGITIIIGGLRKDQRQKTVKKIPILGDIPGLGHVFRQTQDNLTKSELVILLTPHIMSPENPFTDFSQAPPQEGAIAKMEDGDIITEEITSDITNRNADISAADYYKTVTERINALAAYSGPKGERGKVNVRFLLAKNGHVMGEPKILTSSNNKLTAFALNAVKLASPFPPFPRTLKRDKKQFKVTIDYK